MDYKDYYKILGVSRTATEKEIKSAFRKLAQQYHPDKNPGNNKAEDKFKEINEANEVLSDPQKRAKYDQLGASYSQWERAGRPGGGFDFSQWGGAGGGRVDLNDLFGAGGAGGFSDFFTTLFGNLNGTGAGGFRSAGKLRGDDMEQPIEITLDEALTGAKRTLQFDSRRIEVSIPAGAKTGTKVRISGEGGNGQARGDLYLVVTVAPHPKIRREGADLHGDFPVDLYAALFGGEARVPTLSGEVVLTIPAETQSGQVFRLSGQGMPHLRAPSTRGDFYARALVHLPTPLSVEEKKLFTELAALRQKNKK